VFHYKVPSLYKINIELYWVSIIGEKKEFELSDLKDLSE